MRQQQRHPQARRRKSGGGIAVRIFSGGGGPTAGPENPPALETLLRGTAAGDADAFAGVYDAVAGPVLGLVRRVLGDPARSEEVAQQVLLDVWRHAARFDPAEGGARAWIMALAHRHAVERLRCTATAAGRDRTGGDDDRLVRHDSVLEGTAGFPVPAGHAADGRTEPDELGRCLGSLSSSQRDLVVLVYYRGHTCRQAAERLGIALGTAGARLRDGLLQLRESLTAEVPHPQVTHS
ncbi:sigma-70 family RNA polymerase sigma factor [Streptantibioticus silvisoli]|uniref:sigma-70 family RNA polymerase sigma factor n=1 Tax=Streptantibioticus silvisoli TaxID=2705255 RepID=UPI0027E2DA95|nr:sigma-70 family RNA polymerase sigma factor [Streptantibioticus silvisoli]